MNFDKAFELGIEAGAAMSLRENGTIEITGPVESFQGGVRVRPYLAPIADAYAASDLAITRAGAMTTAELAAWQIPPILVPLPTAAADHQTVNAKALAAAGAARWVRQSELDVDRLDTLVRELVGAPGALASIAAAELERARPLAAEDIARRILTAVDLK
jgi:UDP-N-acetylglucosamine--N-acetylmuramyl-(pentapeptide) pyrophosphoryl-undecaprenol N-acetylglucosamine transferase